MFYDVNFMYGLYHDCAKTCKRSFVGKVAIVTLSGDIGFARNPWSLPIPLRVSHVLACLVVHVPATLPVSYTVQQGEQILEQPFH